MEFKEFYTCPRCSRAIIGEKKEFFVCPNCGRTLCQKKELKQFDDNFCGHCGYELASAKKEVLALDMEITSSPPSSKPKQASANSRSAMPGQMELVI